MYLIVEHYFHKVPKSIACFYDIVYAMDYVDFLVSSTFGQVVTYKIRVLSDCVDDLLKNYPTLKGYLEPCNLKKSK